MSVVSGASASHVRPPQQQRPVAPPAPADRPGPGEGTYRAAQERAEQEQAAATARAPHTLGATGVSPLTAHSALAHRRTGAPVGIVADAYGLPATAVRRLLRAAPQPEQGLPLGGASPS